MKKIILFAITLVCFVTMQANAQSILNRFKQKVKDKVNQKVDNKLDQAAEKVVNAPENAVKSDGSQPDVTDSVAPKTPQTSEANFKTYQNYDFIAGEKILFEDHFTDDADGEFPAHWKLVTGQAIVNKLEGKPSLLLTEGNYAKVTPRMKKERYLTDTFTLEFDFIFKKFTDIGYGTFSDAPGIEFDFNPPGVTWESSFRVRFGMGDVVIDNTTKAYPDALLEGFENKWHHAAIIFKAGQMKTYVDQYRVCVNPNIESKPYRIDFDGIGSENQPIIVTNIKLASGGGMNIIGKKFTDTKIVTHGINFDVNKAVIKPESMGTLNGIVQVLKENPDIKFEIGGHTDSDGDDAANLKLSQARADAVRTQLISMGIDAARLTTKGFGETKPISDNTTLEGKANNRRVEFIKL